MLPFVFTDETNLMKLSLIKLISITLHLIVRDQSESKTDISSHFIFYIHGHKNVLPKNLVPCIRIPK